MISGTTTLGALLEAYPALVEVLAGHHPHFAQLRDREFRRRMAPRLTVAQAARVAGIAAEELLGVIGRALGEPVAPPEAEPPAPTAKPAALAALPESAVARLDVRDDIRRGREPFARIMAAAKAVGPGQALVLRAPFEPVPLYDVLGARGFDHWTEAHAADDWSVWFYRQAPGAGARVLDVRGLEPPQPMVLVLGELERLQPGERLEVIHARSPMLLYPLLDERGFAHATDEPEPGVVRIVIERRGAA